MKDLLNFKGKELKVVVILCKSLGSKHVGFGLFPGVLKGLGSSGRLVGSIAILPGTYKPSWFRHITKTLGGFVFRLRHSKHVNKK